MIGKCRNDVRQSAKFGHGNRTHSEADSNNEIPQAKSNLNSQTLPFERGEDTHFGGTTDDSRIYAITPVEVLPQTPHIVSNKSHFRRRQSKLCRLPVIDRTGCVHCDPESVLDFPERAVMPR